MTTRTELLDAFEAALDGWIIRCDASIHPVTLEARARNENTYGNMPDKRSQIIEIEESPDGSERLERHVTYFWDDEERVKKNAQFYCVNRNQPDGYAYWLKAQDPKPPAKPEPEPTFEQVVLAWLRNKVGTTIGPWLVKHVRDVSSADETAQTAEASALCEDETGPAHLLVFLNRNAQGDVQMEVLEVTRLGV